MNTETLFHLVRRQAMKWLPVRKTFWYMHQAELDYSVPVPMDFVTGNEILPVDLLPERIEDLITQSYFLVIYMDSSDPLLS